MSLGLDNYISGEEGYQCIGTKKGRNAQMIQ